MNNNYKKKIDFKDYNTGTKVDIELRQQYTILNGDSGTGKTWLYKLLDKHSKEDKNILCVNIDTVEQLNKAQVDLIDILKKKKNTLIFIDQADEIFRNEQIENYVTYNDNIVDSGNFYIICSRNCQLSYNARYWAVVKVKDNNDLEISLNYPVI